MDVRPIVAIVITLMILFVGMYTFSNKLNLGILNEDAVDTKVEDARRNIPTEASFTSDTFNFNFDTTKKAQNVNYDLSPSSIKINNQVIKSRSNESSVELLNFSGKVSVADGSATLTGKAASVYFGDYEFTGTSSVEISGKIISLGLSEVGGNFKFDRVSGTFVVITNQSVQNFTVASEPVEMRNFLGSIEITNDGIQAVNMDGVVSRIVLNDFTLSKDY